MVIGFVGVATFDEWATGATSILQAVIFSKPEAPVEERHHWLLLALITLLAQLHEAAGRAYLVLGL